MTRRSFQLRQGAPYPGGSDGTALRVTGSPDDSSLRGDGWAQAPSRPQEAYFTATPWDYDKVLLDWNPAATVTWEELIVVGSMDGFPVTAKDGRVVLRVVSGTPIYSTIEEGLEPGRWQYYSLFAQITSGPDTFLERIATDSCLVPFNHRSTDMLYRRLPEYYRLRDLDISGGTDRGPLYRFISIMGWDMDYMRTMVDSLRDIRDPILVPVQAMRATGEMLGIGDEVEGISDTRYRWLLRNTTFIRKQKGSLDGIRGALNALSGYQADVTPVTSTRVDIRMYAQRVNLVKNPKFGTGTTANWTTTLNGVTASAASDRLTLTNSTGSTQTVDIVTNLFAVVQGYSYGAAFDLLEMPASATLTMTMLWDGATPANYSLLRAPVTSATTQRIVGQALMAGAYATGQIRLRFSIPNTAVVKLTNAIVEPGPVGTYFDGDTVGGGWLPGSTGVADYRWETTIDASPSYYNLNYGVTKKIIMNAMPFIIPVGIKVGNNGGQTYEILDWGFYPGKT